MVVTFRYYLPLSTSLWRMQYVLSLRNTVALMLVLGFVTVPVVSSAIFFNGSAETHLSRGESPREVHIDESGEVLVRGAQITSHTDTTMTVTNEWGDASLSWTLLIDADTDLVDVRNRSLASEAFDDGDTVSFSGTINNDASGLSVEAEVIKNWSDENSQPEARLTGTVASIDVDDRTFELDVRDDEDVVVVVTDDTRVKGNDDEQLFAMLRVDDRATVSGSYDEGDEIVAAEQIVVHGSKNGGSYRDGRVSWLKDLSQKFNVRFGWHR